MCGIAGWVDWSDDHRSESLLLKRMTDAIRHRGPDAEGFFENGPAHLGHRRLSIIDLETGSQPLSNEDDSMWIVFNGEIFNFESLRVDLQKQGHKFRTKSDTETIVHLYEQYGERCVEHLRGQFAFAIWDKREQRLFLARDRLGQKPLYFFSGPGFFAFASELKALMIHPKVPKALNREALDAYLVYRYVPDPLSIINGVQKLLPAHTLTVNRDGLQSECYWRVSFRSDNSYTFETAADRLDELLTESTRLRMIADVPLGAFLSGGIDSSLVVAYMSRLSDRPVKTFCIGFEEESHDERAYARRVAERFETDHHEFVVTPNAIEILPLLVSSFDEPFADSSALPVYYLAEMTRKHVTVALNGDGGDESFVGYSRYKGIAQFDLYRKLPTWIRWLSSRTSGRLEKSRIGKLEPVRRIRDWEHLESASTAMIYEHCVSSSSGGARSYLTDDVIEQLTDLADERFRVARALNRCDSIEVANQVMFADQQTYLPGDLLVKVDRMTMRHSLEGRSPFLDHKLVEFAASLPCRIKFPRMQTKRLLKHLLLRDFPTDFVHRKKMGFGVPLATWFRGELNELVSDTLSNSELARDGILSQSAISRAIHLHTTCEADMSTDLWSLLNLESWYRTIFSVLQ